MATVNTADTELATFGAGCFWSTEQYFRKQFRGNLISAVVGYMGDITTATDEEVCTYTVNHVEVLQISFEPKKVAYSDFVRFFFNMHDPTMLNKLGNGRSAQYRSVIYTHTKEQQKIAEQVRDEVQASGKIKGQIITQIQSADELQFYMAEPKHQKYLQNKYGWLMQS
jgi:peptide-methionine (S)-S-oxide reductase